MLEKSGMVEDCGYFWLLWEKRHFGGKLHQFFSELFAQI
jgi:hypothetical protein